MTKLGTPIGAGPNCATVRLGLVGAGEPSGLRRVGLLDLLLLALGDLLGALALLGLLAEEARSCRRRGLLAGLAAAAGAAAAGRRRAAAGAAAAGRRRRAAAGAAAAAVSPAAARAAGGRGVVLGVVERAAAARVGEIDQAVAVVVGEVRALREGAPSVGALTWRCRRP